MKDNRAIVKSVNLPSSHSPMCGANAKKMPIPMVCANIAVGSCIIHPAMLPNRNMLASRLVMMDDSPV